MGAVFALLALFAAPLALPALAEEAPTVFKIYVEEPGVYRVRYEDLRTAGLERESIPTARLGLAASGRQVPIFVQDGGDGSFGPGDFLEFVGERLAGETSRLNEYTPLNVYLLETDAKEPARIAPSAGGAGAVSVPSSRSPFRIARHVEKDLILLRFPDFKREELWYWAKLTYLDAEPFRFPFGLDGLDVDSTGPVTIRIALRGLSQPARKPTGVRDHRIEVLLNGKAVASGEWDGTADAFTVGVPGLLPTSFLPGENSLEVRVPPRPVDGKDPLVDVSVLNWIELEYPRTSRLAEDRQEIILRGASGSAAGEILETQGGRPVVIYGTSGRRVEGTPPVKGDGAFRQSFPGLSSEESFWAVPEGTQFPPAAIEPLRIAGLAGTARQADYILIVHPRLREAAEPLAAFHRRRGLSVAVVDVREIYDEFNHGILHPRAIRDFLKHAVEKWKAPAPRFVLLMGDASWDTKNQSVDDATYPDLVYRADFRAGFFKARSTPYPEKAHLNHRNLIPTWAYDTYDGHAAGDNWFAALGEPDGLPRLAIGRFTVTEPEEVSAIVAKTVAYAEKPEVGPWRRRVLWISNGTPPVKQLSDALSSKLAGLGLGALKVFPDVKGKDNAANQKRIREAFDAGQLFVHFHGHGGRFIWLTVSPTFERDNDLFTLADLELLQPTRRLPIVLAMTCFSAPFDHPSADSIGEKLLRLPGKGAVAVIAASWRNAPTQGMSDALLAELSKPGTVGEALMRAKRRSGDQSLLEQYNLLGDPALPVGLPALALEVATRRDAGGGLRATARIPARRFAGRALVEWFDENGDVVESSETPVDGTSLAFSLAAVERASRVRGVSVYVWDPASGTDGLGGAAAAPEAAR